MGDQVHAAALKIDKADAACVGGNDVHHFIEKALRRLCRALRAAQQVAEGIQCFEGVVFGGQIAGFVGDFLLQILIEVVQPRTHLVEAFVHFGKLGQFVGRHLHAQLAVVYGVHAFLQAAQRQDNPCVEQHHHNHRADQDQRKQDELEHPEPVEVAVVHFFDGTGQRIDDVDKRRYRGRLKTAPACGDGLELRLYPLPPRPYQPLHVLPDLLVVRQEQRTRRHAGIQIVQRFVKFADIGGDFAFGRAAFEQQAQAVGLHPQAACVVDGRRAAFQPPRQHQRQHDGGHRHNQPEDGQEFQARGKSFRKHGSGLIFLWVVDSNKNLLYRHSRAGGNPEVWVHCNLQILLKIRGPDSRLRGNDEDQVFSNSIYYIKV